MLARQMVYHLSYRLIPLPLFFFFLRPGFIILGPWLTQSPLFVDEDVLTCVASLLASAEVTACAMFLSLQLTFPLKGDLIILALASSPSSTMHES